MKKRSRILLLAIIAPSTAVLFFLFTLTGEAQYAKYDGIARAAIIDQLHDDLPNLYFQRIAKQNLEEAGYQVDLYTTKNVTVNFYKNLPSMGYKIILMRTHASVTSDNSQKPDSADLFTGERYQPDKYTFEQILGLVRNSAYLYTDYRVNVQNESVTLEEVSSESGTYFSVGSKFVDGQMIGKFPGSIVIIGGCTALSNPILAESLVKRGASVVIGWDNLVRADHNDMVMLAVLKGLVVDKSDVEDVVQSTMERFGPDPDYSGVLEYYPSTAGRTRV